MSMTKPDIPVEANLRNLAYTKMGIDREEMGGGRGRMEL